MNIDVLAKQGHSIRSIARELNISRNTVRKYLRGDITTPTYADRKTRPAKLDPYKDYLRERIDAAKPHWIPATVLLREITALGYTGKISLLRQFLLPLKSAPKPDPVVRFETAPGEQMQIDFTTIKRGGFSIKAFVATLGYSRACFVKFSPHERQEDWLTGIREACQYFGGVPKALLFDNAKCLIIERDAYGAGEHRWNPELLALSKDYGFQLKACRPYRAQTKGKVERFNGYLKNSFITPLAATLKQTGLHLTVSIANAQIGQWLQNIAHQRIHGTTQQKPQVLLDEERSSLMALPEDKLSVPKLPLDRLPPIESIQHPLSTYDQLLGAVR